MNDRWGLLCSTERFQKHPEDLLLPGVDGQRNRVNFAKMPWPLLQAFVKPRLFKLG
jgi:hypothetical protein